MLSVSGVATAAPVVDAVLDAASGTDRVAPASIVSIYGTGLAPCTEHAAGTLPVVMCEGAVEVAVDGTPLRIFFVSSTQINALLEDTQPTGERMLEVSNGAESTGFPVSIQRRAPQVFVIPRFAGRRGGFAAAQRFPSYELI
ncbi:MAG: hypothetical protein GY953_15540, partial [bacterium]|nr:hypothetical protein [bacterium]